MLNATEVKVDSKYTKFEAGSEFIGFLPVKDNVAYKELSIYAPNIGQVVPVFIVPKERTVATYMKSTKSMVDVPVAPFVFNSEKKVLEGKDREKAQFVKDYMDKNPVVLYFMHPHDGQGMRFKNREEALEYLELVDSFDDIAQEKMLLHK